jgi:hypothetical protein
MPEPAETPDNSPAIPLQFETAEGTEQSASACSRCGTPFSTEYHELNGQPVCAVCRAREEAIYAQDQQWSRFVTAAVYGTGAAIGGAALYWAFVKVTHIELGLMAIAVGWLVGRAVMKGSNMRGGRRYQYLALALTYFSITFSYGALMVEHMIKNAPKADAKDQEKVKTAAPAPSVGALAVGLGAIFLIILAAPFLAGFSNILGWVIIAIGLFEAWKQARPIPFTAGGPYRLGR